MNRPSIHRRAGSHGFTLIELMIVVAVIAILAAVAYPSYNEYVRKSRRAQAKADLVEYAQQAERFHTTNNTYVGFAEAANIPAQSPREAGSTAYYGLNIVEGQSTFTITATAQNGQAADKCGNLSLNHAGQKTNSSGLLSECW